MTGYDTRRTFSKYYILKYIIRLEILKKKLPTARSEILFQLTYRRYDNPMPEKTTIYRRRRWRQYETMGEWLEGIAEKTWNQFKWIHSGLNPGLCSKTPEYSRLTNGAASISPSQNLFMSYLKKLYFTIKIITHFLSYTCVLGVTLLVGSATISSDYNAVIHL
jgi:hypothetical protein